MSKEAKSEKTHDLLAKIKSCLKESRYRFSQHALVRKNERFLSLPNIMEVLNNGYHEKAKDTWDSEFKTWNYAVIPRAASNFKF